MKTHAYIKLIDGTEIWGKEISDTGQHNVELWDWYRELGSPKGFQILAVEPMPE
jgi:hypothetical protein